MPGPALTPPSATSLAFAGVVALTAAFARCSPSAGPPPAAPAPSAVATNATEPSPSAAGPTPSAAEPAASPSPAAAPAPSASAPPASAERHRYVVAAIGDSLTDARSHGGKYLEYLQAKCPESRFDNYGKGGDMVNQMHKRFPRDVLGLGPGAEKKPAYTHLIVFGGVNDLYSDLTAGRTPELDGVDLAAMYQAAHEHGMKVVALTVAPWGGFTKYFNEKRSKDTQKLNAWIKSELESKAVDYVVDAYALLSCGDPERLCPEYVKPFGDGLHFGPPGHEKLGQALYREVFSDCR